MSISDLNRAHYEQLYQDPLEGRSFEVRSKTMIFRSMLGRLAHQLPAAPRVLDIGFGSGDLLRAAEMELPSSTCFGIEPIEAAVSAAQSKHPRWNLAVASADAVPFPDASFDVVACSHVLEHLPDDRKPLQEIGRLVKPGGFVVIGVPSTGAGENELHERLYSREQVEHMLPVLELATCCSYGSHPFLAFYGLLARLAGSKPGSEVQTRQAERRPNRSLLRDVYLAAGVPIMLAIYALDAILPTPKRHPLEVWAAWTKRSS